MITFDLFRIRFSVSVGFAGMLALMLYIDESGLMLLTFEAIALHEAGHLLAMWLFHCKPDCITLKLGAANLGGSINTSLKEELWIALAGPVCNLLGTEAYLLTHYIVRQPELLRRGGVMLIIGLFNLLPVRGLDGGTVLYCLLAGRLGGETAGKAVWWVSVVCGAGLLVLGVAVLVSGGGNPSLLLLAVYLLFGILLKQGLKKQAK